MSSAEQQVAAFLRDSAWEGRAFWVGGCVRDRLLGEADTPDLDLVVEGSALALAQEMHQAGVSAPPEVYPRFGTAMIRIAETHVELAGSRRESYDPESRKPDTEPAPLIEDMRRRDFTINALMRDPISGNVVDLLGSGLGDLEAGIIRTPLEPEATFSDDPLRMLRAVRFRNRFSFEYAAELRQAIRAQAHRLAIISNERIRDEWSKMLVHPSACQAMEDLLELGLLERFAPELNRMVGVEQGTYHSKDTWGHTLDVLAKTPDDLLLRLATLYHDVGKPDTREHESWKTTFYGHERIGAEIAKASLNRLHFGRGLARRTALLVRLHMRLCGPGPYGDAALRRLIRDAEGDINPLLELIEADAASLKPDTPRPDMKELRRRIGEIQQAAEVTPIQSPLSGAEVIALGVAQGPQVGRIIQALDEAVIDGEIDPGDKDAARALAQRILNEPQP